MKSIRIYIVAALAIACLSQCRTTKRSVQTSSLSPEDIEAREDSLELVQAYVDQAKIRWSVTPDMETEAIQATATEDAADDPAIWIHPTDATQSLIYGSNKRGGLAVYDLSGAEVDYYPIGSINNVDIITQVTVDGKPQTLLGCSNRTTQAIDIFIVSPTDGKLSRVGTGGYKVDAKKIDDIYGFCFARSNGREYAVINGKNGMMQQFEMKTVSDGLNLELVREMQFNDQTEGMAADELYDRLYVGVEDEGVWVLSIDPMSSKRTKIPHSGAENPSIIYDVEGISIYENGNEGYLLASSQGNFSYAVFDRKTNEYIGSFKVEDAAEVDGIQETDGIDVVRAAIGDMYPSGIFVAQDGYNYDGDQLRSQNFKLVDWTKIAKVIADMKQ